MEAAHFARHLVVDDLEREIGAGRAPQLEARAKFVEMTVGEAHEWAKHQRVRESPDLCPVG